MKKRPVRIHTLRVSRCERFAAMAQATVDVARSKNSKPSTRKAFPDLDKIR